MGKLFLDDYIKLRIRREDKVLVKRLAKKRGIGMSAFLRRVLLLEKGGEGKQ